MNSGLILSGVLLTIGMILLFAGCTSNSGDQGTQGGDTQSSGNGNQQQSPAGDQPAQGEVQSSGNGNQQQAPTGDQQPQGVPGSQQGRGMGQRGGYGEAFVQSCDGKTEGDVCSLTFRNQTMEGKCNTRNGNLTCTPNNSSLTQGPGGPGGLGGMNAQFAQACSGKNAGDSCTLTMRNQTMPGTCTNRNGNITCAPNRTPGQGSGGRGSATPINAGQQ